MCGHVDGWVGCGFEAGLGLIEKLITNGTLSSPDTASLCPGSWHHIQNLDSFFTKISFVPSVQRDVVGNHGAEGSGRNFYRKSSYMGLGIFLDQPATSTAIISGTALPVSCWRISSSWGENPVLSYDLFSLLGFSVYLFLIQGLMYPRLDLNSCSSCLYLLCARINCTQFMCCWR